MNIPPKIARQLNFDVAYDANHIENTQDQEVGDAITILTDNDISSIIDKIPTTSSISIVSSISSTSLQDRLKQENNDTNLAWEYEPKNRRKRLKARYNECITPTIIQITNKVNHEQAKLCTTPSMNVNSIFAQPYIEPKNYNQMMKRDEEERSKWLDGCHEEKLNFFKREVL